MEKEKRRPRVNKTKKKKKKRINTHNIIKIYENLNLDAALSSFPFIGKLYMIHLLISLIKKIPTAEEI